MWRSRSRVHGEWKTCSVRNDHELRTFAPLGFPHFKAPFFATTKVPSMKHSAKSIRPRSSRSRANASRILRSTPALTQRLKRRKQVDAEGNRSGRSAQAAPVRNTHRMPLSAARLLCFWGLPRPSARRTVSGIRGSRTAHCSSVSSSFLAMQKFNTAQEKLTDPIYEMSSPNSELLCLPVLSIRPLASSPNRPQSETPSELARWKFRRFGRTLRFRLSNPLNKPSHSTSV